MPGLNIPATYVARLLSNRKDANHSQIQTLPDRPRGLIPIPIIKCAIVISTGTSEANGAEKSVVFRFLDYARNDVCAHLLFVLGLMAI